MKSSQSGIWLSGVPVRAAYRALYAASSALLTGAGFPVPPGAGSVPAGGWAGCAGISLPPPPYCALETPAPTEMVTAKASNATDDLKNFALYLNLLGENYSRR